MRVSFIFGTRPEAIKLCPLIARMREQPGFEPHVCVTGQHREMLQQVLSIFRVEPDVNLQLMTPSQTLAELTSRVITAVDKYLLEYQPDLVLVQGDTSTVFASSLCAFYQRIAVGHVEAGLRTGRKYSPFPEEINRLLTSRLSDLHFAPTESSRQNLLREGISADSIFVTGNTVVDALLTARAHVRADPPTIPGLPAQLRDDPFADRLVLITGHRRENFGEGFRNICESIARLAQAYPQVAFVYPVHLNPNVLQPVHKLLSGHPNVHLLKPLDYRQFVWLMDRASFILTDSGGVQEEAPSLGKKVLVMRDTTERPEAVAAGVAKLVGTQPSEIIARSEELLLTEPAGSRSDGPHTSPFGDGHACERILSVLRERFSRQRAGCAAASPQR